MTCSWTLPSFTLTEGTAGLAMDCRVGLRWYFLLWLSKFKNKISFGFLIKKIRGRFFLLFSKSRKMSSCGQKRCFTRFQRKFDRFQIISICKQFRNIRAYNLFVATSLKNFVINRSIVLVIACTLVFRSISIDTNFDERDRFSSKNTAAGLPKTLICRETETPQKHLRPPYQSF